METTTVQIESIKSTELIGLLDNIKRDLINVITQNQKPEIEYITRDQAAKMLQISLVTLDDWAKKGLVKPYYIGNKTRYLRHEILQAPQKRHK